jgi:hypothetical protein
MHLTEDELVLHYYGELDAHASARAGDHLRECATCHASFTTLQRVLATVESASTVDVREGFERTVWARLQPELERPQKGRFSWLVLSPARLAWVGGIVVLVAAAFFAGRFSQRPSEPVVAENNTRTNPVTIGDTPSPSTGFREQILLSDLGSHLDRSQMMLIDLVSADSTDLADFASERTRAGELAADNRLYRQAALANGNASLAAVLDDLEQVLVDVAASPDKVSAEDLNDVRRRIENKGLLLKVRVMSTDVQRRQKAQIRSRAGQSS